MEPISNIGGDTGIPFSIDWEVFKKDLLIPNYYHQPLIARKLAGNRIIPVEFDGKYVITWPTLNDIDVPKYAKKPMENDIGLDGGTISGIIPQMSQTINIDKDDIKVMFAGRSRLPLSIQQMLAKMAELEDTIFFSGDTGTGVTGIITGGTSVGATSDDWEDAATGGIMKNMRTDVASFARYFDAQGYPGAPIDFVIDHFLNIELETAILENAPFVNNKMLFQSLIRGGNILVSDNIPSDDAATKTATSANHYLLGVLRLPTAFTLMSSEIEQAQKDIGLWNWRYGLRRRFSLKVLTSGQVGWMKDIDLAD